MGKKFNEHGILMYLSNQLYIGFVKLQADKGLGRSYAALLPFVEGLYKMGYITEKVYLKHKEKYSQPLIGKTPRQQRIDQQHQQHLDDMAKQFRMVIEQWHFHPDPEWRKSWIQKATKYKDKVPNAKLVLALEQSIPQTLFSEG